MTTTSATSPPSRACRRGRALVRTTVATVVAALLTCAGAVAAQADEQGEAPAHGHFLVLGVQFGDQGLTFRSCVDVGAGRQLPLHAHHEHLHHGSAADALQAAGNYVVPTMPITPWADCAAFEETFRP